MADNNGQMNDYPPVIGTNEFDDFETGELVSLPREDGSFRLFRLEYWVGVSESTAFGFALSRGVPVAVAVVHFEPVTALGLRAISVQAAGAVAPWMPRWDTPDPPSPERLRRGFRRASGQLLFSMVTAPEGVVGWGDGDANYTPPLSREKFDSPEAFYAEVASYYRWFEQTTGKPTDGISQSSEVPHSTAARWVREARRRGFLPPSKYATKGQRS